jgi:hypothetical protein
MLESSNSFFRGRDFPRLRFLDVSPCGSPRYGLYMIEWGSMPELRSLHLSVFKAALGSFAPLETLVLCTTVCHSLPRYSSSLTRLMLDEVSFEDAILGPVNFPVLTYLSLYDVGGLKPNISAPRLVTYHEGRNTVEESFSAPLVSLVEYGLYAEDGGQPDLTKCHRAFPNISRLSIRMQPTLVISFLDVLANRPLLLPALRMISAGSLNRHGSFTKQLQATIESLIRMRSSACSMDVAVCFKNGSSFQLPIFFADVRRRFMKYFVIC